MFNNNSLDKYIQSSENGFIILTIPVLLLLFGFFVSSIIKDTKPNQFYFETATQQEMIDVKTALAAYAHRNYRIPCPADPAAPAANLGSEGALGSDNKCANTKGILPFKELGLTEEAAKDEWGNYLTYKVSPDFTLAFDNTDLVEVGSGAETVLTAPNDSQFFVHELCRTPGWVNVNQASYNLSNGSSASMTAQNMNQNVHKARFCCASNVSGTGSKTFLAKDQVSQNFQRIANLISEEGDNDEIYLSVGTYDDNIALIDEDATYYTDGEGREYTFHDRRRWNLERYEANGYDLEYKPVFEHDGHNLGDGFGPSHSWSPEWEDRSKGKFLLNTAFIEFNTDKVKTDTFEIAMSDIGPNNWEKPIQISIDVKGLIDHDGNESTPKQEAVIDKISYVLLAPIADGVSAGSPQYGVGDFTISLDQIMGEADQEGLFHTDEGLSTSRFGAWPESASAPASSAVDLFNASKSSLTTELAAKGLTINDVYIGSININATHTSMGFSSLSYGSPGASTPTDLIIRDEAGSERLTERTDSAPYGSSDDVLAAGTAVTQDFEAAAYALISHGPDGEGSYIAGGAQLDNIPNANENPDEVANHSDDREVRDIRKISSSNPAEKFDDIIMWDSQITLYNALRNGTCEKSQAL